MPNHRDVVSVFGLYDQDVTLNGIESLDGGYIGVRCLTSGELVGSFQIDVMEKGDHDHDDGVEF